MKRARRNLVLVSAAILLVYPAFVGMLWVTGDAISQASTRTTWLLRTHSLFNRPQAVLKWLGTYHGEAPGSEVMGLFVEWSIAHPSKAEELLATVPEDSVDMLSSRMAWSAIDRGLKREYLTLFSESSSRLARLAAQKVRQYENARSASAT